MMIRVARVITRLNVGGPAYQAVLLSHLLTARGYETLLLHGVCEKDESSFDRLLEQFPCRAVACRHLRRSVAPLSDAAAFVELARILRRFRPDVVHTHTAKAGLLGRLAGKAARAKAIVHTFHGHVLDGYFRPAVARGLLTMERGLARMTDALVTVSPRLARDLVGRLGVAEAKKVHVIELGLPLSRFLKLPDRGQVRERLGIGPEATLVGTLGRLVAIKNHARLIEVARRFIPSAGREVHFVIGGTGPLEGELRSRIAAAGLAARVHLLGLVDDLPAFYADIDAAILTSDNEGTPVTLLEAQAAERPVVAPDVGGVADVVGPEAGIVVKHDDVDAYVAALREALDRPPPSFEQRRTVVERFSPERLASDVDSLYRSLLGEVAPGKPGG